MLQRLKQVRMPDNATGESREAAASISGLIQTLRETRRAGRITQLDLAARLGVTELTVVEWEARRDVPATGNLFRWAQALGYVVEVRESSSGETVGDPAPPSRTVSVESRMRRIPKLLRQKRVAVGLTQEELGVELSVSTWTIRMWESGQRTPRLAHLVAWCTILDCQLALTKD